MGSATVWLDALTPKQARLASALAARLRSRGLRVLLTVRDYDYTVPVAERFARGVAEVRVVGRHGGGSRLGKLRADLERSLELADIVEARRPCMLVSYPSPSALRVAFGLGVPSLVIVDSPHAYHANRLAVSLADYVVHSSFVPRAEVARFVLTSYTRVYSYRGVDELEYVLDYVEGGGSPPPPDLEPRAYVVVRPAEYKAAYYQGLEPPRLEALAAKLARRGVKVVFFPRYPEQAEALRGVENVVVPEQALDTLPLLDAAAAVVTGGATLAREAALLGTPGLYMYPRKLEVCEALAGLGLPLHHVVRLDQAYELVLRVLRDPDAWSVKGPRLKTVLRSMERPSSRIVALVENHCAG